MRYGMWLVMLVSLVLPNFVFAQEDCSQSPAPRMVVGQRGQIIVVGEYSDGMVRVRREAGVTGEALYDMLSGEQFSVVGEAQCADGYRWWEIVTDHGVQGWSAEGVTDYYFMEPLSDPNPDPLPPAPNYLLETAAQEIAELTESQPSIDNLILPEGFSVGDTAFSPDGARVAVFATFNAMAIFETSGGSLIAEAFVPDNPPASVNEFAWSPDGAWVYLLAANYGPEDATDHLYWWNPSNGDLVYDYAGNFGFDIYWSRDSTRFVLIGIEGAITSLQIRQPNSDILLFSELELRSVWDVAWSPDGTRLAIGGKNSDGQGEIQIWDTVNKFWAQTLTGNQSDVWSVAWSPDGQRLASGNEDGLIRIYQAESSQLLMTLEGHENLVLDLEWSPDGSQLTSTDDQSLTNTWQIQ